MEINVPFPPREGRGEGKIERGNISKLENHVDNVELNTLVRLADALGYDVVVDLKKREPGATP